jgi:hypothetical protein
VTITISSEDPRSIKAIQIAAGAGQWLKCRTTDGRKAHGVPSSKAEAVNPDETDGERNYCMRMSSGNVIC